MILRDFCDYRRKVSGARYGVEVEVEGVQFPRENPPNWEAKPDGSLSAKGLEFVTQKAFGPDKFELMLGRLDEAFKGAGTDLDCGVGCSVHVHMNVQDLTISQILNIIVTYYILEDCLVKFCGDNREGNLFCLRLSDGDAAAWGLVEAVNQGRFPLYFTSADFKYAALNLSALGRFGTLEFRSYGAIQESPLEALGWLRTLNHLRDFALQFNCPQQIISQFSMDGPRRFFRSALGPFSQIIPFDETALHKGMRQAQIIAFSANVEENPEKNPKPVAPVYYYGDLPQERGVRLEGRGPRGIING